MASKESEKQMVKTLQDLLRQVSLLFAYGVRTAARPVCAASACTLLSSAAPARVVLLPLQLYEIETIVGDFTQAASQELLLSRL